MEKQEAPKLPWGARTVFGILISVLVLVALVIFERFEIPGWPAFLVMILYFVVHQNNAAIRDIVIGGAFGIFCYYLAELFIKATAPTMGILTPTLIFVGVFVFLIVLLTDILPYLFNSYAFMYFLISSVATASEHEPLMWLIWIGSEVIGGLLLILGVIGSAKVLTSMVKSQMSKSA